MSYQHKYNFLPEYQPCYAIGIFLIKNRTEYTVNNKITDPSNVGQLYLHDKGIKIRGSCYFSVSDLRNIDPEVYKHFRNLEIVPKLSKPKICTSID
jgi:hypothetical protein